MDSSSRTDMVQYTEAYRRLPRPTNGYCKVKDSKQKHVDFDCQFMRLWDGSYHMSDLENRCLINKWAGDNKINFSSYSIMKNVRHHSIITIENHYDQSGQSRLVLSWVDGSLTAWLRGGGYKKCFETAVAVRGSFPSKNFRRMIIDTCRGLEHLFEKGIYPVAIAKKDLYVRNEHKRGYGPSIKILITQAEQLWKCGDKDRMRKKLSNDVKTIFEEICKEAGVAISVPAERFIRYIGNYADVDKLEGFPDNWSWKRKECYLFCIISEDSSKVYRALQKINFHWPKGKTGLIHPVLRKVIDYEKSKKNPTIYNEDNGYDYLRLCRNIVKHWKVLCKSVKFLQESCATIQDFLRTMESWTPDLWCILYEEIGWPKAKA